MNCAACASPVSDDARFCARCGASVREEVTPAAVDPLRETLKVALGRQYEVVGLLGRGGMGAVYLARETALEREVAIKILPPDHGATPESRDRFRREARTAARLSHPNIVPLHTFGDVDGTLFFVMGYVKGESLASLLRREGRLSAERARRILIEVAQALAYAHDLGIIHRDIKPDNVLIDEDTGRAMLTDFGVAKALGAGQTLTALGSLLGTPHYMSPEQAMGKSDIDHRSDLYSLGVMAFSMLTGRLPFEGSTTADVLVQHMTQEAPSLKTLAPEVPVEMATAIQRCMAKQPNDRWPDARSFAGALEPPREDDVPPDFADLREFAIFALAILLLMFYGLSWRLAVETVPDEFIIGSFGAAFTFAICITIWMGKWWFLRRQGYDSSRIVYETFKQPRQWISWYPKRFRVRGDVWDRLPVAIRRARVAFGFLIVLSFLVVIPALVFMMANTAKGLPGLDAEAAKKAKDRVAIVTAGLGGLVVFGSLGIAAVQQSRWRKQARALGYYDRQLEARLTTHPTGDQAFWSRPEIAVALLPAGIDGAAPPSASTSPREIAETIARIAGGLQTTAREPGQRAASTARALLRSVEHLDKQIGVLAQTVDPSEKGRLEERLKALPSSADREVRESLQKQCELVERLERRLDEMRSHRSRCLALFRSLWESVAAVAAQNPGALERMRTLCADISGEIEAMSLAPAAASGDIPTLDSDRTLAK